MTYFLFRNKRRRTQWLRTAGWQIEAALLYLLWLLVRPLPAERASAVGRKLFRWLGPRTTRQQRIKLNLALAFPDLRRTQLDMLVRDIWENFGSVLSGSCTPPAVEMEIDPATRAIIEGREPAIHTSAHLGNWELAAPAIAGTDVRLNVVYAPQTNPLLDRMLQSQRRPLACRFIGKKNSIRWLMREICAGRSVGLLPD